MRLRLIHLYGDLMNLYGDRGNIIALERRCAWRGIDLEVAAITIGDRFEPADADLLFFGGGQDHEQTVVSQDLLDHTGEAIDEAVQDGAGLLAVCGGYQLLGTYFRTAEGIEIPGTGLFAAHTIAGQRRNVGNVVAEATLDGAQHSLVGFENHSGRTYLAHSSAVDGNGDHATEPLARVLVGNGNNGEDGFEGARRLGAIGSYLHGPILPKNPWLADWLILTALRRRIGPSATLDPLNDGPEDAAHAAVKSRILHKGNARTSIR